ncbi:hemolysin family protein [Microbacterium halotolerans]|uniref:hemolysin family protein n=1 Tax=Microbacterium halotolerans TaxID=246613 RepID=UPI001968F862|nr:hemolysin family protein [Microbacterium halotolerans]
MSGWLVLVITTALIVLSGFFVVIEFALMGARRHRLEAEAPSRASARAALRGMNQLTMMLAAAQLGITACTFALGAVTKPAIDHWLHPVLLSWGLPAWLSGGAAFAASLLLVTFLHLVVGEMAPKSWAIAHPELAARIIGIPSRVFVWPLRPFLGWVNAIANALVARTGVAPVDRAAVGGRDADTIRQLVEHSAATGALEPDLQAQISEAIRLKDLTAGDIRTGAKAPTSAPADATVSDVQRAARESGHLRVLLRDSSGEYSRVVHVRDTLTSPPDAPTDRFARPVLRVPEGEPVYELLRRMRDSRVQLALVTGERGSGVVTMKDVIQRVLPAGRRHLN